MDDIVKAYLENIPIIILASIFTHLEGKSTDEIEEVQENV